jgi:hypothetical protein
MKKRAKGQRALGGKIVAMLRARDAGKAGYARADELLEEIVGEIQVGKQIKLGDGTIAELVDNFEKGNKAWKPCGISRFDIKITHVD